MTCSGNKEPKGSASSSTECRFLTHLGEHCQGHDDDTCCACGRKPHERCQHLNPYLYGSSGSGVEWTRHYLCEACGAKWETVERRNVPVEPQGGLEAAERAHGQLVADMQDWAASKEIPEPPMTPEEEEQAPEDGEPLTDDFGQPIRECWECDRVGCKGCKGCKGCPPQPDRRPPSLVAYSVQGHLYEVALSGDAAVRAVDGGLVITHALGPVAGIVQVAPVPNEEQG